MAYIKKADREKRLNEEQVSNGGEQSIKSGEPYRVQLRITGTSDFLFHRWNCEAVAEKAAAAKNSVAKKTDDLETFVYRDEENNLILPGEYLRQATINAARKLADPASPRGSAKELFKAGIIVENDASFGKTEWDYEDQRRVTIQRNGITRVRPAMRKGWQGEFIVAVIASEYITPELLHEAIKRAGTYVGVGDYRPTYGRFAITEWNILEG